MLKLIILLAIFISVTFQIVMAARRNKDNLQMTKMEIKEIKCKNFCLALVEMIPGMKGKAAEERCHNICNKDLEKVNEVIEPFMSPTVDN